MKALVYLRVSTEEQAKEGYSMQAQRMEGVNKAIELGCSPEDIYIFGDEGISGVVLERPQLMAALDMLKKRYNDISYFICYDSSRLSRNAAHQLILIDEIKKSGTQPVFIRNSYQDNAEGRFQLTVMAAVDEYERARLKLRTEMGKRAKAVQHKLTHNPGLYGYDFDAKSDILSINEKHAQILKRMFELLVDEGKGPSEIAGILNDSGVPSPRMRQWSRVTVRRILKNPSYLGTLYIRRYDTRDYHLNKFKSKGEKIKVKEKPQNEWVPVQIPQIIDKDIWEKAQNILNKTKRTYKREVSTDFLLTPLLKCGVCGRTMNCKSVIKDGFYYRYYLCSGKYNINSGKKCESMLVRADEIEKVIWDCIFNNICSHVNEVINARKIIGEYIYMKENDIKNIVSKKEKTKSEKQRIITMFQKGYIRENEMSKMLGELEEKLERLDAAIARKDECEVDMVEKLRKHLSSENTPYIMESMLKELDTKGKKHVLNLLVSEITVSGNTIAVKGKLI